MLHDSLIAGFVPAPSVAHCESLTMATPNLQLTVRDLVPLGPHEDEQEPHDSVDHAAHICVLQNLDVSGFVPEH